MSNSVRLHHPQFANVNYVVELPSKEMPADARACNACSRPDDPVVHRFKSIHLRLDGEGNVFVARGIYELLLREAGLAGMQVVEGRNAPPQYVGAIEQPTEEIILADRRFYVPGRTKYEARDRTMKPFQPFVEAAVEDLDRKQTKAKAEKKSTFIFGKRKT